MNIFMRTPEFDRWLKRMKDMSIKARVLVRIRAAETGNFGDCESVGDGVFEMRIHAGAGCRIYYFRQGRWFMSLYTAATSLLRRKTFKPPRRSRKDWRKNHERNGSF